MRHTQYNDTNLIPLDRYITDLQKDITDVEWDGGLDQADFLRLILKDALDMKDKGEVWYPLF